MRNHHEIIRELDAYAEKVGVDASTVCRNATGNPRLRERLERRLEQVSADVSRLRKFMIDNPPSVCPTDVASPKDVGSQGASFKGGEKNSTSHKGFNGEAAEGAS